MAWLRAPRRAGGRIVASSRDGPEPTVSGPARRLLEAMPKAELHLHLDGSLRSRPHSTWREPAASTRRATAAGCGARSSRRCRARPRPSSCARSTCRSRCSRTPRRSSGSRPSWSTTKAADGVRYVEIRWGPLLHTSRGGLSAAPTGSRPCAPARPRARRPRTGIVVRLICTALRSHDPDANVALAEAAAGFLDHGLTGFDLAGPEEAYPDPMVHVGAFEARASRRPPDHPPCRRVGRRGTGPPRARAVSPNGSRTARARSTTRPVRRTDPRAASRSTSARPRNCAGGDRPVASRPTRSRGSTGAGVPVTPQHGRLARSRTSRSRTKYVRR